MIITKQAAKELNKDKLADMATKYANELVQKLGNNTKVEILPQDIIYDRLEAHQFFTKKYAHESPQKLINVLGFIQDASPFVEEGVAYTPLSSLSRNDYHAISKLAADNTQADQIKNQCMSIKGFGAETAHLVGHKLYGPKTIKCGLGETMDIVSQIYEDSINLKTIDRLADKKHDNLSQLEKEILSTKIEIIRKEITVYEEILFKGEDSAEKLVKKIRPELDDKMAKKMLEKYKVQYVSTSHFDGLKIFLEIYDKEHGNMEKTYKTLGQLLADPKINNIKDVLEKLGYSGKKLKKYKEVFQTNTYKRIERLAKHAKVYCRPIIVFTP
ncbi:MAG: hypothetical protein Q8O03_00715 [Nanoarchaeota archaeon]|nr:hypothetical protein [Nanoarchaeota archaeon]